MPVPTKITNIGKAKDHHLRWAPGFDKGTAYVNVNQSHENTSRTPRASAPAAQPLHRHVRH